MKLGTTITLEDYLKSRAEYEKKYDQVVRYYLPFSHESTLWRYCALDFKSLPLNGFKLHISATILQASAVLEICAELLIKQNIYFKAANSLSELKKLNIGLYYGIKQIGKFITVYPANDAKAIAIADVLDRATRKFDCVKIPYDKQLRKNSNVFYRYGSFKKNQMETTDLPITLYYNGVKNNFAKQKHQLQAVPNHIADPFKHRIEGQLKLAEPLMHYIFLKGLSQRGKGGTYLAMDTRETFIKNVIIKEGRKNGELDYDLRDGYWRIENERNILRKLSTSAAKSPSIIDHVVSGRSKFLILEKIDGVDLHFFMQSKGNNLNTDEFIQLAKKMTSIVSKIHEAKVSWGDCKLPNFILQKNGNLRPIDFEGAALSDSIEEIPWGTVGFKLPKHMGLHKRDFFTEDIYGLGACFFQLLTGEYYQANNVRLLKKSNLKGHGSIIKLIIKMLHRDPLQRAGIPEIYRILRHANSRSNLSNH